MPDNLIFAARNFPMDITGIMGTIAATLTTLAFVPQAYKIIRSRHTKDISLVMYSMLNLGILSWLIYGLLLGNWPVIISNSITILFTIPILYFKLRYR